MQEPYCYCPFCAGEISTNIDNELPPPDQWEVTDEYIHYLWVYGECKDCLRLFHVCIGEPEANTSIHNEILEIKAMA